MESKQNFAMENEKVKNTLHSIFTILFYVILVSVISILPGWLLMYNAIGIEINVVPYSMEIFVKTVIAICGGFVSLMIMLLIIMLNVYSYNYIKTIDGEWAAAICCSPGVLLCLLIINMGTTYCGYILLYDIYHAKLNVDEKHEQAVKIITSFVTGWVHLIIGTILALHCCVEKINFEKLCCCCSFMRTNKIHEASGIVICKNNDIEV